MISFTPVKVDPETLDLHLRSLGVQDLDDCWFYDDNDDPASSELLRDRCAENGWRILDPIDNLPSGEGYVRSEKTHTWPLTAVARVAMIKNRAIYDFIHTSADHMLLCDADLLPYPGTVEHLRQSRLPIVSGIFWSKWHSDDGKTTGFGPNVWDVHPTVYRDGNVRRFLESDHHEVGGLGAFTLIERDVLKTGLVHFGPVKGVGYFGEDRHFCIRASVLGIPLIACSHVKIFHVYRPSDVEKGHEWVSSFLQPAT